eukprot:TRINITY_DN3137_c0_g1_i1.p1 TRINITY_DN3137_c0_g1~~TRINITY_DN3137_c0_g1_i1.p1  ORF type:complete len:1810 (+),score=599.42 TRINITY_DN3137_c0_g1_i1:119-5548(+)
MQPRVALALTAAAVGVGSSSSGGSSAPPPAGAAVSSGTGVTPAVPWLTEFTVEVAASTVTMNLTGPADAWFAVGFGGSSMSYSAADGFGKRMDKVWAVVVSGANATTDKNALQGHDASVESWQLGTASAGTRLDAAHDITLHHSAVAGGMRSVMLSTARATAAFTFTHPATQDVPFVAACGFCGDSAVNNTLTFGGHGAGSRWNDQPGSRFAVVFTVPPVESPMEEEALRQRNCTRATTQGDCDLTGCAWRPSSSPACVPCELADVAECGAVHGCSWLNATGDHAAVCEAACETNIHVAEYGVCVPEQWVLTKRAHDYTWFEINCPVYVSDQVSEELEWLRHMQENLHLIGQEAEEIVEDGHQDHGEIPYNILVIFGAFAMGAAIRFLCLGTKLPYTVIVFLFGLGYGLLGKFEILGANYERLADMDPHLIFFIFLPVLIFESAFAMEIPVFKQVLWQCIIMAGPGLLVAATCTGLVAKFLFTDYDWPLEAALLFGTIMSATDPVAVVALLKELGASKLISTMIEGESLFNDGTAIVFFNVLKSSIERGADAGCEPEWHTCAHQCYCDYTCKIPMGIHLIVLEFFRVALGGPLIGLLIGIVTVYGIQCVFNDSLIEITLTLCSAYVTFFLCEGMFHVSGVLGLVVLGCYLSYFRQAISPDVEHTLHHFWEITVYLTNTCIFALAGMIVAMKAFDGAGGLDVAYLVATYATINVVRMLVLLLFTPALRAFKYKLSVGEMALVAWGGLRGAVGLALALVIQGDDQVVVPNVRDKFIFQTAGIVILTLLINGTTTQLIVKRFELDAIPERRKKMMSERFEMLTDIIREDILDLGWNDQTAAAYYDCNWEIVYKSTDLFTAIPSTHANPYMMKTESLAVEEDKEKQWKKGRDEGRAAYFRTVHASTHKDYALGVLSASSVRDLEHAAIEAAAKVPDGKGYALMESGNLNSLFVDTKFLGFNLNFLRSKGLGWLWERQELIQTVHGYDVSLGFVSVHGLVLRRIRNLCEPQHAGPIETHCKKSIADTKKMLKDITNTMPGVSCSIKTKYAARSVLNSMRHQIQAMERDGMIDGQDKAALMGVVLKRMKNLMAAFPRSMNRPTALQALENCPWFEAADAEAQRKLSEYVSQQDDALREFRAGWKLMPGKCNEGLDPNLASAPVSMSPRARPKGGERRPAEPLDGIYIVVSGVVQIRLGRRIFLDGGGYTIGLQSLLTYCPTAVTGSERFSDAVTDSPCVMVFLPRTVLLPLLDAHPLLASAMWKVCGQQAARILMSLHPEFVHWDERRIRHLSESGNCEMLQDSDVFEWDAEVKSKLRAGDQHYVLLRGRCWEYEGEEPVRFPEIVPSSFKFATFTNHAVIFEMDAEDTAFTRARKRWGRLRFKMRAIGIWSGLRSPRAFWARVALSRAFNRSPPPDVVTEENYELLEQLRQKPPQGSAFGDDVETPARGKSPTNRRGKAQWGSPESTFGDAFARSRASADPGMVSTREPGATMRVRDSVHVRPGSLMLPQGPAFSMNQPPPQYSVNHHSMLGASSPMRGVLPQAEEPLLGVKSQAELAEEGRLRRLHAETELLRRQIAELAEQRNLRGELTDRHRELASPVPANGQKSPSQSSPSEWSPQQASGAKAGTPITLSLGADAALDSARAADTAADSAHADAAGSNPLSTRGPPLSATTADSPASPDAWMRSIATARMPDSQLSRPAQRQLSRPVTDLRSGSMRRAPSSRIAPPQRHSAVSPPSAFSPGSVSSPAPASSGRGAAPSGARSRGGLAGAGPPSQPPGQRSVRLRLPSKPDFRQMVDEVAQSGRQPASRRV